MYRTDKFVDAGMKGFVEKQLSTTIPQTAGNGGSGKQRRPGL